MTDILEMGRKILAQQPFSVLLGVELTRFEPGLAELLLPLRPDHLQQHGFAHGGLVSTMADNAISFAGGSRLGDVVTLEYKLNLIRPGVGEALIARGTVMSFGKTQAVCRADVFAVQDGQERLCAAAQGTMAAVNRGK
ncbi:PaaI family thioesterase [Thalassobius sp. S69A]|uniref:PaaI family thioesterase n=1 Tax=unclassified Thalassovita TaxID=2619711 RepID=UPI000C523AFD|nr:phenylacetic acid degradation protein [Paracoccaceae bacterium]